MLVGYLDPGTGSIITQVALAGIVGGTFTLKRYWRRMRMLFRRSPHDGDSADVAPDE